MKNKKGISLIVLVITIIVMIILAASVVISLSSTGVIEKANVAVVASNKKQIENIASMAWADAYMEGARNQAALQTAVDTALQTVDTSKYTIIVTEAGVSVADGHDVLNEYGFYYDRPYKLQDTTGGEIFVVFRAKEVAEQYVSGLEIGEKLHVDDLLVTYSSGKIIIEFSDGTDREYLVADNGNKIKSSDGTEVLVKVADEYRGVYYNTKYYFPGVTQHALITADNKVTIYNAAGTVLGNGPVIIDGHYITYDDQTNSISMDGRVLHNNTYGVVAMIPNDEDKVLFKLYDSDKMYISAYNADLDMTWREWVASDYNTIGAKIVTPVGSDPYITVTCNGIDNCVLKKLFMNNVYVVSPDSHVLPGVAYIGDTPTVSE